MLVLLTLHACFTSKCWLVISAAGFPTAPAVKCVVLVELWPVGAVPNLYVNVRSQTAPWGAGRVEGERYVAATYLPVRLEC